MAKSQKYFQFPLCCLAYGKDFKTRLSDIAGYCCVDVGEVISSRVTTEVRLRKAEDAAYMGGDDCIDFNEFNDIEVSALVGAAEIAIRFSDIESIVDRWGKIEKHKSIFEKEYGRDAEVRMATRFMTETYKNAGLGYREFSVLCAIYSCIGSKRYPVRITRSQIQCRQLGYKSQVIMKKELPKRMDGAQPLTLRQINYTLDALHERGFFSRARANARQTYYSNKLKQEELEEQLIISKTYSSRFHHTRREKDRLLIKRIKQIQSTFNTYNVT